LEPDDNSRVPEVSLTLPLPDDFTTLLNLLQSAPAGSRALDALIGAALSCPGRAGLGSDLEERWSEDLMALLQLVPRDHNCSLGERDGVVWAWIQPNDDWAPGDHEMRHNHPRGSGLIVASTLPLAMAAAVVIVRSARGTRSPQSELKFEVQTRSWSDPDKSILAVG
jgi:hypothetical protein